MNNRTKFIASYEGILFLNTVIFYLGVSIVRSIRKIGYSLLVTSSLLLITCCGSSSNSESSSDKNFVRKASFVVATQIDSNANTDTETAAEIVAASTDGLTLIYTDSPAENVGFVNLADPSNPIADGIVALDGEPTSVAVKGDYAIVGVNNSADFINVAGNLKIVQISTKTIVATVNLVGQPDSIAVSPDGNYAAVVIENERDEDLGDGAPP